MSHDYSRGLFFKNYDLYDTEGVNGPAKQGPGTGLFSGKYKSVQDFLKKRRKNRMKKRKKAMMQIFANDENDIDFESDSLSTIFPYDEDQSSSSLGLMDGINPEPEDNDGHTVGKLYYGTDDNPEPIAYDPFGIPDGNTKAVDVEPDETKNLYYGIK